MTRSLLFLVLALSSGRCAQTAGLEAGLREISTTARTNLAAARALNDRLVGEFPTNAQPLQARARLSEAAGRYAEGVKDLTAALKLEPGAAGLWQGRGELNFKAGRFRESVADFDEVLRLSPRQAPYHWQRGISLYYAGRFADGRRQFESHRTVNPNDVENAAWHFLCAARESGVTNARSAMLPVGPDARVPMKQIDALFRGPGTVDEVLAAAHASSSREATFYAHLYLGLYLEAMGDRKSARDHIRQAAEDPTARHYMGDVARVHWNLLRANP